SERYAYPSIRVVIGSKGYAYPSIYVVIGSEGDARARRSTSGIARSLFTDPEISTQAEGAQSFGVPIPLPEDPYEAISTPPTCHVEESKDSDTSVLSLHKTALMAMRVPPAMSPGLSASIAEVAAMSDSMSVRVKDDEEDEDDEEDDEEMEEILGSNSKSGGAKEKGPNVEDEDPTAGDEGLTAGDEGPVPPIQTLPSPEWSSDSLLVSPTPSITPSPISSPMIPLTVPSPAALPAMAKTEGSLTELGAQVEMQGGLIRDYTIRLGDLSPALFERYDRDIGELFNSISPGVMAGQTDTQRAALWHTISDTQIENRELRLKIAEERLQQKSDGIFISQEKYVADILKKFDFTTVKTTSTLMKPNKALVKDVEAEDVDVHLYISIIGSLMYLTASRPDITFAVCACARFQVTLKTLHLHAVKEIFRYSKGQPKLGLWKSTIEGCQFLDKRLISWQCKKQTIVANSTTEAEYVVAASCCGQDPTETETPESPHTVASLTSLPDSTPPTCHAKESKDSDTSCARSTSSDSIAPNFTRSPTYPYFTHLGSIFP
nr:hypothetical protein [Tanacetum cinerariifolium]